MSHAVLLPDCPPLVIDLPRPTLFNLRVVTCYDALTGKAETALWRLPQEVLILDVDCFTNSSCCPEAFGSLGPGGEVLDGDCLLFTVDGLPVVASAPHESFTGTVNVYDFSGALVDTFEVDFADIGLQDFGVYKPLEPGGGQAQASASVRVVGFCWDAPVATQPSSPSSCFNGTGPIRVTGLRVCCCRIPDQPTYTQSCDPTFSHVWALFARVTLVQLRNNFNPDCVDTCDYYYPICDSLDISGCVSCDADGNLTFLGGLDCGESGVFASSWTVAGQMN